MSWFSRLFAPGADAPKPVVARSTSGHLRPARDMTIPEAKRIEGESVRVWCEKLDREYERTGNPRLRQQAANIRARFKT